MASSRKSRSSLSQTVVDIQISCRNLPPGCDPFCVLHVLESSSHHRTSGGVGGSSDITYLPSRHETKLGRTEVVSRCCDPDFYVVFRIPYRFEHDQRFCLRCYTDTTTTTSHDHSSIRQPPKFLGGIHFSLAQVVGAVGNSLFVPWQNTPTITTTTTTTPPITPPKRTNSFIMKPNTQLKSKTSISMRTSHFLLRAMPTRDSSDVLRFQLTAQKLKRGGFFGHKHMNPYYVIKGTGPDHQSWVTLWESSVVNDSQNPIWDIDEVSIQNLCNGDYHGMVQIQIMDFRGDGNPPQEIGGVIMSVNELLRVPNTFELMRPTRNGENKAAGLLSVVTADILNRPTMVDYITGGCDINLMVAVDFTISNGPPDDPTSLHYRQGKTPNEYQQAIFKIGSILEHYATNKCFPIWGFGAKVNHVKQDCLDLGNNRPGVQGLLDAYESAFDVPGFDLSGPTNFAPVLRAAAQTASAYQNDRRQSYSVLVILTDGLIVDVEPTVDTLRHISSTVPLSIIIIGVGKADFKKMERLIGDDGLLRDSKGQIVAERDFVQFVPYRNFVANVDKLTAEVLYEIPKQLVGYFQSRNIKPNAPVPVPSFHDDKVKKKSDTESDKSSMGFVGQLR